MKRFTNRLSSLFLVLVLLGAPAALRAETAKSGQSTLNDGYSLFYDFCGQESQLSLLLYIKTTPPDIADYARNISATAKEDIAILDKLARGDSAIQLHKQPLPSIEAAVRKEMGDDRKHLLIWGSSGPKFAQAVRMTQSEVINYGYHVAKVLSETEPNADRAQAMQKMYEKWASLHNEADRLDR